MIARIKQRYLHADHAPAIEDTSMSCFVDSVLNT
jgi:hypothetical protein